ncbi:MAG: DUF5301 domain-containing protein [Clostridium celatum]|nr:DUF5301 domain-containing protein [Clostridium celatum]MDU2123490.1 DUF5301 domain-containing protein [Clostridium celatum]MDU4980590.1 DUF5301 domain-containing protein [Clostridium celatum]
MKKYLRIILVLTFILTLTACGSSTKKIVLPESKNIKKIEIVYSQNQKSIKIDKEDELSKLISDLNDNSKGTNEESVNDQPTNVEEYITIKFHHKISEDNPSIVYLYDKKGNYYLEQPYSGIWKLKDEVYDEINEKINK